MPGRGQALPARDAGVELDAEAQQQQEQGQQEQAVAPDDRLAVALLDQEGLGKGGRAGQQGQQVEQQLQVRQAIFSFSP